MTMHVAVVAGLVGGLLCVSLTACDAVCPAAFEPSANPVGQACSLDKECRVECVCQDPGGDERGVLAGDCYEGVCLDAHDICEGACGARTYAGEFCETRR
jgi:hypothetical protein